MQAVSVAAASVRSAGSAAFRRPLPRLAYLGALCAVCLLAGCGGGGGGSATAASTTTGDLTVATAPAPASVPAAPGAPAASTPDPATTPTAPGTNATVASAVDPLLTLPAPDATGVAVDTPIVVAYDGDVQAASTSAVLSSAGGAVPGTTTVAGNTIVFTPSSSLSPGTAYTFAVVTEVPGDAGPVATGNRTAFSTAAL